jgi:hypothetical protein
MPALKYFISFWLYLVSQSWLASSAIYAQTLLILFHLQHWSHPLASSATLKPPFGFVCIRQALRCLTLPHTASLFVSFATHTIYLASSATDKPSVALLFHKQLTFSFLLLHTQSIWLHLQQKSPPLPYSSTNSLLFRFFCCTHNPFGFICNRQALRCLTLPHTAYFFVSFAAHTIHLASSASHKPQFGALCHTHRPPFIINCIAQAFLWFLLHLPFTSLRLSSSATHKPPLASSTLHKPPLWLLLPHSTQASSFSNLSWLHLPHTSLLLASSATYKPQFGFIFHTQVSFWLHLPHTSFLLASSATYKPPLGCICHPQASFWLQLPQ